MDLYPNMAQKIHLEATKVTLKSIQDELWSHVNYLYLFFQLPYYSVYFVNDFSGNLAPVKMKDALSPMKDHNSGILAKINSITAISNKKIPKSPGTPRKRRHLSGTLSPVTPMKEHNSGILAKISSITAISSTKDAPKSPGSLRKSKSAVNISSPNCRRKSTKYQRPITPTKSRL